MLTREQKWLFHKQHVQTIITVLYKDKYIRYETMMGEINNQIL